MGTDIKVNDKIVFYDGFCVMCSRFIRFIVFLDKRKTFKFSAISSDYASKDLSKKLDEKQVGKFNRALGFVVKRNKGFVIR